MNRRNGLACIAAAAGGLPLIPETSFRMALRPREHPAAIENVASPESRLLELLGDGQHGSVSTAESCTGGGVAARLTSVSGSSAYVMGGIVSYSNEAKMALLQVDPEIIATDGPVSEACALAMARGSRRAFGTTWAVSTTGIAGPTGATATKPVGLVYIAVAGPDGEVIEEHVFPGDRAAVTSAAIERAVQYLLETVEAAIADPVAE